MIHAYKNPCIQCGDCCTKEVCIYGNAFLQTDKTPCPALIFDKNIHDKHNRMFDNGIKNLQIVSNKTKDVKIFRTCKNSSINFLPESKIFYTLDHDVISRDIKFDINDKKHDNITF